jgi:hypothetical protein
VNLKKKGISLVLVIALKWNSKQVKIRDRLLALLYFCMFYGHQTMSEQVGLLIVEAINSHRVVMLSYENLANFLNNG